MERQLMELAGLPAGTLAGLEQCALHSACSAESDAGLATVVALLGAFAAVLDAEELLREADMPALAGETRVLIETIRAKARSAIQSAAQAPSNVMDRLTLLDHAIDLEGADGPLVLHVMQILAVPRSVPAVALIG